MNNVSSVVESQIKLFSNQLLTFMNSAANIAKNYTATTAESLVTGAATSGTGVTVSTQLTQYQFEAGITFCTQVANFFGNSSVSSADYLGICQNLITGSTAAVSILSSGVEALGLQLLALGQNAITYYNTASLISSAYNQNGLAQTVTGVSGVSSAIIIPGCSTSAAQYTAGITMVNQFINLMNNQSVSTNNYENTATSWVNS